MTVTMMCEQRCRDREPLVARSPKDSYYWLTASKLVFRTSPSQWCSHPYLFCILPHSFWGQERPLTAFATHHHNALLISNPIEKVHASWHALYMRRATRTRNVFSTKNTNSLISSQISIHLVHTIQSNSHFDFKVSVSHLHWNLTQRGCPASLSQKYLWLFTDLPSMLDYFSY